MDRINGAGTIDIGGGKRGFRDENLSGGTEGTEVTGAYMTALQEEIMAIIEGAGQAPDDASWLQLLRAIRSQRLNYLVPGGTANAITVAPTPAFAALADLVGVPLRIKAGASVTAAATLNVNGLGAEALTRIDGTPLQNNDILAGQIFDAVWDGAQFQVTSVNRALIATRNAVAFTATGSHSWTVPDGVYAIHAHVWSGGGGGGGCAVQGAGAGGNGGGYGEGIFEVTPGQVIPLVVGAGGTAGTLGGGNGGTGGSSSVGSLMSATGGGGGGGGNNAYGATGASSTVTGANVFSHVGSTGQYGSGTAVIGQGGFGGCGFGGGPAFSPLCTSSSAIAGSTNSLGGGGSGASCISGSGAAGGAGGAGRIIIEY